MRWTIPVLAVLALAACEPKVPDSGSYGAAIRGATDGSGADTGAQADVGSSAGGPGYLDPNRPRGGAAPAGIANVQSTLEFDANGNRVQAPQDNRAAISDEQDFGAVKSRYSIEQDAARLAQQRAQYQVIQPTALPSRPSSDGPNLADYALSTSNPVGHRVFERSGFGGKAAYDNACGRYPSPDLAQEAFLSRGGPARDPLGLDPDGDGYACSWDPTPFRRAGN